MTDHSLTSLFIFFSRMRQCGSSKSVQQFSSLSLTMKPQDSQNLRPTVLSTCMCRQIPSTSDFSVSSFSRFSIICLPMPYFLQGARTPKVRMQACFFSWQSSSLTVQAPMTMSLQYAYFENSVQRLAIFMQRPVEYLTGKVSKLSLRRRLMFWLLMSPMVTLRIFFLLSLITINSTIIINIMEWVRTTLRVMGRVLIFSLLALLITSRWLHPEGIKSTYVSAYENLRQLAMVRKVFVLPLSRHIPDFFEVLMWVDLSFEIVMGLLILFGKRLGGWMMFFWNLVKIAVCYSPYLFNAPRLPFTHRERFDIVRNFAILGVSLALTHIYKPYESKTKPQQEKILKIQPFDIPPARRKDKIPKYGSSLLII